MKTTIFAVIAVISSQVAAAIPHGRGRHDHVKKDLPTETITETTYVTVNPTDPAVIIWVDTEGNAVSTETRTSTGSASAMASETTSNAAETPPVASASYFTALPPAPAVLPSTSSSIASFSLPVPTKSTTEPPPPVQMASTADDSGATPVPTSPNTGSAKQAGIGGQFSGLGIAYDVINDQGGCKNAFTVEKDFDTMAGYSAVRIYSTSCNQVAIVAAQAAQRGMKVFAGIGDPTGNIAGAVQEIVSQAGSNLGVIDTISIGNEYVSRGGAAGVVVAAIGAARAALSGVYSGSIVTVDTCGTLAANPALCAASDYCAANCHAFFTASTTAAGAGADVQNQVNGVAAANPGKAVVVTESGWAWKDSTNSNPKATPDQQAAAITSLRGAFTTNLFLFQGFDTLYKGAGTEGYFGIYGHND